MRPPAILLCLLCISTACIGEGISVPPASEPSQRTRERLARSSLQEARTFIGSGDLKGADRATARGLEAQPDDPQLLRLRAHVLDELGRNQEAIAARQRADALDPLPPTLPEGPLEVPSQGLLIVLLPLPSGVHERDLPPEWPDGEVGRALTQRLRTRLPEARQLFTDADSMQSASGQLARVAPRAVISLRIERAFFAYTKRDGAFALARIRAAAAADDGSFLEPRVERAVIDALHGAGPYRAEAVARALEQVLASAELQALLAQPALDEPTWSSAAMRALFPQIGENLREQLADARARRSLGDLAGAVELFREAHALDPDDIDAASLLAGAEAELVMSREISRASGRGLPGRDSSAVETQLDERSRRRIESRLRDEQALRERLLATVAVLDDDARAPRPETVSSLTPVEIEQASATGLRLAELRARGPIEARALYAPGGALVARYFFAAGSREALLREEDNDGDGSADRWIAYEDGVRRELWEDRRGRGFPDLHFGFGTDGETLDWLAIDAAGEGRPQRRLVYAPGATNPADRVTSEARDTSGDGRFDVFETFGDDGSLRERAEDLDGNGEIDLRSGFEDGRLAWREIVDPEAVDAAGRRP